MIRYGFTIRTRMGQRVENVSIIAGSQLDAERRLRQMYIQCEILECRERAHDRPDGDQPADDPAHRLTSEGVRLQQPLAHLRNADFGGDHDDEHRNQDQRDAIPLKQVERGIERHADAACADEAEHGRLADIDVEAE